MRVSCPDCGPLVELDPLARAVVVIPAADAAIIGHCIDASHRRLRIEYGDWVIDENHAEGPGEQADAELELGCERCSPDECRKVPYHLVPATVAAYHSKHGGHGKMVVTVKSPTWSGTMRSTSTDANASLICTCPGCARGAAKKSRHARAAFLVPLELAGTAALIHHANHEGKPHGSALDAMMWGEQPIQQWGGAALELRCVGCNVKTKRVVLPEFVAPAVVGFHGGHEAHMGSRDGLVGLLEVRYAGVDVVVARA